MFESRGEADSLRPIATEPAKAEASVERCGLGSEPSGGVPAGLVEKYELTGELTGEVEPAEKDRRIMGEGTGMTSSPMSMPMARPCGSSVSAEVRMRDGRLLLGLLGCARSSPRRIDDE